jgi:polysaccharide pyruvyl transferase WcaK-like protein
MSENETQIETMQKKLEDLDKAIDTFIQVVKEVKEMKESAGLLHARLIQNADEIESQKKELERLMSSSSSLIAATGEQTRGIVIDLEKKSEALMQNVKTGIAHLQELQTRPYDIDIKLKKLEERLEQSIQEKHSAQKIFTWAVLLILIAAIFFTIIIFFLS